MQKCIICGSEYPELHHIIFRSQCKHMINVDINFMYLCNEHHRGNNSPHRNRSIDLKYKKQLQDKLFGTFKKQFITVEQLVEKLKITETNAYKIVKTLIIKKEGYDRIEVIRVLMGGKLY